MNPLFCDIVVARVRTPGVPHYERVYYIVTILDEQSEIEIPDQCVAPRPVRSKKTALKHGDCNLHQGKMQIYRNRPRKRR